MRVCLQQLLLLHLNLQALFLLVSSVRVLLQTLLHTSFAPLSQIWGKYIHWVWLRWGFDSKTFQAQERLILTFEHPERLTNFELCFSSLMQNLDLTLNFVVFFHLLVLVAAFSPPYSQLQPYSLSSPSSPLVC